MEQGLNLKQPADLSSQLQNSSGLTLRKSLHFHFIWYWAQCKRNSFLIFLLMRSQFQWIFFFKPEKYRKLILNLKNKCPYWLEFTFATFLSLKVCIIWGNHGAKWNNSSHLKSPAWWVSAVQMWSCRRYTLSHHRGSRPGLLSHS